MLYGRVVKNEIFDNTCFIDYKNFSLLFAIDHIPFRLIALRQAIRKHMTYASIALTGNENWYEAIRLNDLRIYFFFVRIDWQRATDVLIL